MVELHNLILHHSDNLRARMGAHHPRILIECKVGAALPSRSYEISIKCTWDLPVYANRKTDLARYGSIGIAGDPTEARAVKRVTTVGEVLVIERVERNHAEFDIGALFDIGPLDQAEVSLGEMRTVEGVEREV